MSKTIEPPEEIFLISDNVPEAELEFTISSLPSEFRSDNVRHTGATPWVGIEIFVPNERFPTVLLFLNTAILL